MRSLTPATGLLTQGFFYTMNLVRCFSCGVAFQAKASGESLGTSIRWRLNEGRRRENLHLHRKGANILIGKAAGMSPLKL